MNLKRNIPLIVTPYSSLVPGGLGTWTKNMIDYSESDNTDTRYNILFYSNHLRNVTNLQIIARIITGLIVYTKVFFRVLVFIKRYRPSVLHITSSASLSLLKDLLLIWLARVMNIPTIIHWHFGRIPDLAIQRNWEWKILGTVIKKSHSCIVIDLKSYNTLLNTGFTNVINIPNPIGLTIEHKSKNLLNTINERQPGRILFVGHLIREKGILELVKASSQLEMIRELYLIGPSEEVLLKELTGLARVRENGIWLKPTGTIDLDSVLELMQHSSIMVLPSYTEGFPYVVLEAMAMGCAVIATDVGAMPEMLAITSHFPCGVCVPVKDVEKLREALIGLICDPLNSAAMGKNGIERVLSHYTLNKVVGQYMSLWESALKS